MKVVFAMDSMKGSLSSIDFGNAAAEGLKRAIPDAEYEVKPLADGGEGTVNALTMGMGGSFENIEVTGPLGNKILATYGIADLTDESETIHKTAIIEISAAAGLTLIPEIDRDPHKTTTYGVGEMINDAIHKGCRNFIIGLGGSATNDVGIGMLQALGVRFFDSAGNLITGDNGYLTGADLEFIDSISPGNINHDLYDSAYKSRFITGTMPQLMNFIGNLGYVMVCIVGSMLVMQGQITYGVIVAFIVYVRMFNAPLLQLSDALASMQSMAAASERVFDLLDAPSLEDESGKDRETGEIRGEVEFRDVSFSYVEGNEIIHHFSFRVEPGQKIAIVGPTGAGKTTVVNLLMRFYEVDSGDILIDGMSVRDLRRDQVHSMFAMVQQDVWLFEGTVRENLLFNRGSVSEERMTQACKAVGIHDFVMSLPQGYDTVISDSAGLSSGQKQQLTIARAIIHDAPMVIFDEATSSVDTRTEKLIQKATEDLTRGKTSFIIAHRLTTIENCDVIYRVEDGKVMRER